VRDKFFGRAGSRPEPWGLGSTMTLWTMAPLNQPEYP
jgi:hypothetical protein